MKLQLPSVTLFIYCGGGENPETCSKVLQKCMDVADFGDVIMATDCHIVTDLFRVVPVSPSNYELFMRFTCQELWRYVKTDHVLIVHPDGFIINPSNWTDDFLKYNYIGSPWLDGQQGNAGFNLRSRRLLHITAGLGYNPEAAEPKHCSNHHWAEDRFICSYKRPVLEAVGAEFAPLEIAAKFSIEQDIPQYPARTYLDTFGFHGRFQPWQKELIASVK